MADPAPGERLAGRLTAPVPPARVTARTTAVMVLTELWQVDRAFSRVHAGVHDAGDVVVGAAIGATVGAVVGWDCRGGAGLAPGRGE